MTFVEGLPIPQGSMRAFNNRIIHQKSKDLKAWRDRVAEVCSKSMECVDKETPVFLRMSFVLPRPKSVKRRYITVRPDLDKLARAVNDALTGIAFVDDSQVVLLSCSKRYSDSDVDKPGVYIHVMTL